MARRLMTAAYAPLTRQPVARRPRADGFSGRLIDSFDQTGQNALMTDVLVPTMPFSPAKSQLSEVMTEVVFRHQIRVVSRHHGKEQMLLVGADDLVAMLAGQEFDVRVVFDEGEVTTFVEGLDVLGFGETLDEAIDDFLNKLREYTTRFFQDLTKYLATSRRRR